MASETHGFQAEVSRLLDIVAHSIYSDKAVFLRELISNASDACDRLRYLALTEPELTAGDAEFAVRLIPDKKAKTLTVADNGIGMNRDDLIANLDTIARSSTAAFLEEMSSETKDLSLIGQFGVGFYAAFMVAERVEVLSRKAGESEGWRWESAGKGEFSVGLPWRGPYVFEVQHADKTPGKRGEEAYDVVNYVTSLTVGQPDGLEPLPALPAAKPH